MVMRCLDQNPDRRPTIDEILASPSVASRLHLLASLDAPTRNKPPSTASSVLLDTIKVPRNFQVGCCLGCLQG